MFTGRFPGHVANRLQAAPYREVAYLIDQDVVSVDAAVCMGPGLRWTLMRPNLHLGGGLGGIRHFLEQFADSIIVSWANLGSRPAEKDCGRRAEGGRWPLVRRRYRRSVTARYDSGVPTNPRKFVMPKPETFWQTSHAWVSVSRGMGCLDAA